MPASAQVAEAYVTFKANMAEFRKALDDANIQTKRFRQATEGQMKGVRGSMQETRGSIVLLGEQIGVHMPRELSRFLAGLPGVSEAMNAAFSSVAVLALITVIVEAGQKLAEYIEKSREAAHVADQQWHTMAAASQEQRDQLQKTNDELHNQLNLLENKPTNNAAIAIDDARIAADKLGDSIEADIKKLSELMQANHIGAFDQFMGRGASQGLEGSVAYWSDELQKASDTYNDAVRQFGDNSTQAKNALTAMTTRRSEAIQWAQGEIIDRTVTSQYPHGYSGTIYGDQSNNLRMLRGASYLWQNEQDIQNLSVDSAATSAKITAIKNGREQEAGADKAAQAVLRGLTASALHMDPWVAEQFWRAALGRFRGSVTTDVSGALQPSTASSSQYVDVVGKINEAMEKQTEALTKIDEHQQELETQGAARRQRAMVGAIDDQVQEIFRGFKDDLAVSQWLISDERNRAIGGDAIAQSMRARGYLGRRDAAETESILRDNQLLTQIGARKTESDSRIEARSGLQHAYDIAQGNPDAQERAQRSIDQNEDAIVRLHQELTELSAQHIVQQIEDAQRTESTLDHLFDRLRSMAQDTADKVEAIAEHFLDGINDELAKGMTGQSTDFSKIFLGSAQGLAKTSLERLEGSIFGGGKKNPQDQFMESVGKFQQAVDEFAGGRGLSIPSASSVTDIGTGSGTTLAQKLFGNMGGLTSLFKWANDSNFMSSLIGGKLFGSGSFFGSLGGMALGGDVAAGVPIVTGELGREIFTPAVPGRIIPHNEAFGGSTYMDIDARGSHDPAATYAAVNRAMRPYVAASAPMSLAAQRDNRQRTPQRGRR